MEIWSCVFGRMEIILFRKKKNRFVWKIFWYDIFRLFDFSREIEDFEFKILKMMDMFIEDGIEIDT